MRSVKWMFGLASAIRVKASAAWPNSVCVVRKNLRRTGVLKNRLWTSTAVPTPQPHGATGLRMPAVDDDFRPRLRFGRAAAQHQRLTSAIDANASPRKPSVPTRNRSSASQILLVACGATASGS